MPAAEGAELPEPLDGSAGTADGDGGAAAAQNQDVLHPEVAARQQAALNQLCAEHRAWASVLARMEADAAAAGRHTAGTASAVTPARLWTPPQNLGPLPAELVQRARALEAAQRDAVERLEEAQRMTARHLAAVQSVPEGRATGRSVFLDVTG